MKIKTRTVTAIGELFSKATRSRQQAPAQNDNLPFFDHGGDESDFVPG
jgi:hypothetical protein